MNSIALSDLPTRHRALALRAAGVAIVLLSIGAVFLPAGKGVSAQLIGALLVAGGAIETAAGSLRQATRPFSMAAGGVTVLAGLLFLLNPTTHLFPSVTLVIAWLFIRGLIIALALRTTGGSVRTWTLISSGVDIALALLLAAGLSFATIVVSLFGPTEPLVASFSWFLAGSFVVNGVLLLEVSDCERDSDSH